MFDFDAERPIFLQLAEHFEDAILSGALAEESQLPSITELSMQLRINPATALKGINLLVDGGIAYKKRGVGMFVAAGAQKRLEERRRERFYEDYLVPIIAEARRLQITRAQLSAMLERGFGE